MADGTYTTGFAVEQGAARAVVRSGGSLDVESGGELAVESGGNLAIESGGSLDVESGGSLKIAGTAVTATAAELNAIDISAVGALVKVKKIAVAAGDWSTETDSTWDLPAKSLVLDVFIDVTTTQGGKTVDVGLLSSEAGGDANGFIAAASLATAGIVRPGVVLDVGSAYFDTTTRGVLLRHFVQGANADDRGLYATMPHASTAVTAKSVSYTTSTAITAVFNIYIVYVELG